MDLKPRKNINDPAPPSNPRTKTSRDEVMQCACCRMQVMARGENAGWKGIQMSPRDPKLSWYCNGKEACQKAYQEAVVEATEVWQRLAG